MTSIKDLEKLEAYELIRTEELPDVNSVGYVLKHKKSGARIALVSNDDDNKTFYIGFRTTPSDDTGVAHIIEHTVLCGSRKFPVKDPFVELVKGSLNTFLNAMTYPDKTVYPVASCNDKDFQNLMDVYLDAVFYPNIYKYKQIFEQEGWHYEMENAEDDLQINGVVYNEMKGAYSSSESILDRKIYTVLFPENTYSKDSGGDPESIPSLTYEDYLDFHRKYYHPSNSYIYLYGDMDGAEKLDWLDKEYLSHFENNEVDSAINYQTSFDEMKVEYGKYPISSEDTMEDNTYLSYNLVVADTLDSELYVAFELLDDVLLEMPGAPVKEALLKEGIGQDIYCGLDNGILQPVFSFLAKNANVEDKDRFLEIINEVLKEQAESKLDHQAILASINASEFKYREADFGQYPKGLIYGLEIHDSWLYDDEAVYNHLKEAEIFDILKKRVHEGYFEELIKKYLLNNSHSALVILEPDQELGEKTEKELREKLDAHKASLSAEEITEIVEHTAFLKKYQEEPSSQEDLLKIPMLKREDLKKEIAPLINDERYIGDNLVLFHNTSTNGIIYAEFLFDVSFVEEQDLPYLGLLKHCLGFMDTEAHTYNELATFINMQTGSIGMGLHSYTDNDDIMKCHQKLSFKAKVLNSQIDNVVPLAREILFTTKLSDEKRLKDIISEDVSKLQSVISSSGHTASFTRALSYFAPGYRFQEQTSGIDYFRVMSEVDKNFDEMKDDIVNKMYELLKKILVRNNFVISITCDEEGYTLALPRLEEFVNGLDTREDLPAAEYTYEQKNEGFMDASQIQYVSRVGNYRKHGIEYSGAMRVLKVILSYDYLWINVRVKGGAYGCSGNLLRNGNGYFTSYRDPGLKETNEIYEGIPEYLRNFEVDERDMTKYIIGTMSDMDVPLTPSTKGSRSLHAYFSNITEEFLKKEREEALNTTVEDIRALAPAVEAILSENNLCVIGNETKLRDNKDMFGKLEALI